MTHRPLKNSLKDPEDFVFSLLLNNKHIHISQKGGIKNAVVIKKYQNQLMVLRTNENTTKNNNVVVDIALK